ncbi:MAG: AAA family ATPase, partial [Nanoarchaeota archaeon]|nr:AAA family ATPase [Nanoarchaeota archaeon]
EKIAKVLEVKNENEKEVEKLKHTRKIEEKIAGFKAKHSMGDTGNLEKEIEEIDKKAESKLAEIQQLREKQQNLLREKDKLEYQIKTADEKIAKVLEVKNENEKEVEKLKHTRNEFKKATLELSQRLNDDSSITAQMQTARSKLLKVKEELAKLAAKQASISEGSSGDIAVQRVMELKTKMKGIYGTVSTLGQVAAEHSTALEVAAGSRIKSIVVDNDKTASECIKYLKRNRFGSASFLPLNKMRPVPEQPDLNEVKKLPGVKGLAIELIKFDFSFKNVFSYVFGNTVVVENIDVARNIGIGRCRMATLDGDLTESSGAMHGGFRKKENFQFQEKEVAGEIEHLAGEEADLSAVVSSLERRKAENEEIITKLRHLKAELEAQIITAEKTLHLEGGDLDITKGLKKELETSLEKFEQDLRQVSADVMRANSELAQAKIAKQGMRDKISALKNPALLAELNTFEQKRSELREQIIKTNGEMKNIDVQVTTIFTPELGNIRKIVKQHEKEETDFAKEKVELKSLVESQDKDLKQKDLAQKEFYAKFKELFKKRDKASQEVTAIETKISKKEDSKKADEMKTNLLGLDIARLSAELAGLAEEAKTYEGVPPFEGKDEETIKKEIWEFEKLVRDIGAVNMRALEIYDAVEKEYNQVHEKKATLVREREDVLLMMNEIETKKKDLFMNTYNIINENFQNKFQSLSTKGEATLELEDPETVFEGGMNIKVRLTGKKFLDIRSLSGGEKTMTALAFIFAVQDHQPAPFYVLDEVDAALDKRNSEKLAQLIRQYVKKAQYIVISHNDGVISEADNLYGVSMNEHGMSKVVSLKI